MKKLLLFLLIGFLMSGCAKQQLYNWERYPFSLYKYKKDPTDENLQKHKEMLVAIMENSKEKDLRVPPGIYCEYGFILLKEGKKEEALKYFDLEEKTYPESAVFMQNLKSYIDKSDKPSNANISSSETAKKKEGI
ncbi:DUF4810 domain-containing protein [Dissulfurispira sp.]|uniref:DUF4810 domain-containing protein n=1 Tax=Dissulfurispira sp. TaxID=2817609 RepID=UPI002FDAF0A8